MHGYRILVAAVFVLGLTIGGIGQPLAQSANDTVISLADLRERAETGDAAAC